MRGTAQDLVLPLYLFCLFKVKLHEIFTTNIFVLDRQIRYNLKLFKVFFCNGPEIQITHIEVFDAESAYAS